MDDSKATSSSINIIQANSPSTSELDELCFESDEENSTDRDEEEEEELSLAEQCLSPPRHIRKLKIDKSKTRSIKIKASKSQASQKPISIKHKTKPKRPQLINSADNIQYDVEQSSLADSLTEMQEKFEHTDLDQTLNIQSPNCKSAPPSAQIQHPQANLSNLTKTTINQWETPLINTHTELAEKQEPDLNPFDREAIYTKIGRLLKLALKNNQSVQDNQSDLTVPPPTPLPSSSTSSSSHSSSHYSPYSCLYSPVLSSNETNDDSPRHLSAQNVWKEIFDFFENYSDRADTTEEIDKRLEVVRAEIPQKIENILNTSFAAITSQMNQDISANIKTPADYSLLFDHKIYTDQLCYLYWLVEDVLNEIGYIESLYPSQRMLRKDQPAYANQKFESTFKTLLLWYKIMTDLMHKCDKFGKYLGFAKRPEYLDYWTWFDQRLNYSRTEYERVQHWLNMSLSTSGFNLTEVPSSSTLVNESNNSSGVTSPIIMLTKPTFCNLDDLQHRNHERQISFLLKGTQSSCNLLYNNFENYSPSLHLNDLTSENTNDLSNRSNLSSFSALSDNQADHAQSSPELLLANSLLSNDHLKIARLHHYNSFVLSRSTSLKSTETPSGSASPDRVLFHLNEEPIIENIFKQQKEGKESLSTPIQYDTAKCLNRQRIFSEFLRKRLRKFGLTKTCDEIRNVVVGTLSHALLALQVDRCERSALNGCSDHFYYHLMPLHHKCKECINSFFFDEESIKYGVCSDSFRRLNLPSFRPLYLYLCNVLLDLMHLCIKMQIDNKRDIKIQSNFKFSLLSIEVLTNECRECIEQSILVRQFYYHMIYSVFDRAELDVQSSLENDLLQFDQDLKEIINIYLNFITDWVQDLVKIGDLSKALWVLKEEWNFCKNNLYFVTASEDMYANRFCTMSSFVNESVTHLLREIDSKYKEPLKEYIARVEMEQECYGSDIDFYDSLSLPTEPSVDEQEEDGSGDCPIETDSQKHRNYISSFKIQRQESSSSNDINLTFNEFKEEINRLRKSCMKALGFCSKLIKDLELAAKYVVKSSIQDLLNELKASNHVLVLFTNPELNSSYQTTPNSSSSSFHSTNCNSGSSFMIFVPQEFTKDKIQIVRLLFIISEKDDFESAQQTPNNTQPRQSTSNKTVRRLSSSNSFFESNNELQRNNYLIKLSKLANMNQPINSGRSSPIQPSPASSNNHYTPSNTKNAFVISPSTRNDGYLLYLQLPKDPNEEFKWTGSTIELYASVPVRRSLYQHKSRCNLSSSQSNLILVTSKQAILNEKRIELKKKLKGTISLVKEKTSFHPSIDVAIDDLKDSIIQLRKDSVEWIKSVEKDLKISVNNENPKIDQRYISEIWRVSYNFGIELQNEFIKFMTQDRAEVFSQGLADFSILWCEYIVTNTARGKGRTVRPWVAKKGIQLIQQAVLHSVNLNIDEFLRLIQAVERCILHVIGDRSNSQVSAIRLPIYDVHQLRSSHSMIDSRHNHHLYDSMLLDHQRKSVPQLVDLDRNRSSVSSSSSKIKHNKHIAPKKRFSISCLEADKKRENVLLEKRYIGKILDSTRPDYIINATEVSFRWQLGLLIGEGQYGKVYSCVNLDTGEPMAMKEIRFKSNDIKKIKEIADEINNVQGINHENLVKVYGAELHRVIFFYEIFILKIKN